MTTAAEILAAALAAYIVGAAVGVVLDWLDARKRQRFDDANDRLKRGV